MNGLALFAGIGGIELGLGWAFRKRGIDYYTSGWVECDEFCIEVLKRRFRSGELDEAPIWDDVRTFDGRGSRGKVDIVTGGFPCQDISTAGRGAGIEGERSGLFFELWRIVREIRPRIVIMENVPALLARGMDRVAAEVAAGGYDMQWDCIPAAAVGAPHRRDRVFILALDGGWLANASREPERASSNNSAGEITSIKSNRKASQEKRWRGISGEPCRDGDSQIMADADPGGREGRARIFGPPRRGELADLRSAWPRLADAEGFRFNDFSKPGEDRDSTEGENIIPIQEGWRIRGDTEPHRSCACADVSNSDGERCKGGGNGWIFSLGEKIGRGAKNQWSTEPRLGGVVDGVPVGVDGEIMYPVEPWERGVPRVVMGIKNRAARLRALGNAVVPQVAEHVGARLAEWLLARGMVT